MSDSPSRHVAYEQVKLMLDFMAQHVDFATGQLRSLEARHVSKRLWDELTQTLNSCRGTRKTADGWSRYWSDFKNKLKNKVRIINKRKRLGSTAEKGFRPLTKLERRAVVILGPCFEKKVSRLALQDYQDEGVVTTAKLPRAPAAVKVETAGGAPGGGPKSTSRPVIEDYRERTSDDEATSEFDEDSKEAAEPLMIFPSSRRISVSRVHALLARDLAALPASQPQRALVSAEIQKVLDYVTEVNKQRNLAATLTHYYDSWRQLTEIIFCVVPEDLLRLDTKKNLLISILQDLLNKIPDADSPVIPQMGVLASGTILLLVNCYLLQRRESNLKTSDFETTFFGFTQIMQTKSLPLKFILHKILSWILISGDQSQKLRVNLYGALLNFLNIVNVKSQDDEDSQDSTYVRRLDASRARPSREESSLKSMVIEDIKYYGVNLYSIIGADCVRAGHDACRMVALACIDSLIDIDPRTDWIDTLSNQGFLRSLIDSLLSDDDGLREAVEPNPKSLRVIYLYESRMSLLIRVAGSPAGAAALLAHGALQALASLRVLRAHPDIHAPSDAQFVPEQADSAAHPTSSPGLLSEVEWLTSVLARCSGCAAFATSDASAAERVARTRALLAALLARFQRAPSDKQDLSTYYKIVCNILTFTRNAVEAWVWSGLPSGAALPPHAAVLALLQEAVARAHRSYKARATALHQLRACSDMKALLPAGGDGAATPAARARSLAQQLQQCAHAACLALHLLWRMAQCTSYNNTAPALNGTWQDPPGLVSAELRRELAATFSERFTESLLDCAETQSTQRFFLDVIVKDIKTMMQF